MQPKDSQLPVLIDPVCNMPVTASSSHHCAYGGAMFYFCSDACQTRFVADPLSFIDIRKTEHEVHASVRAPALTEDQEISVCPVADDQSALKSSRELEYMLRGGVRGMIASMLFSWREGRRATRTCRELLSLYRAVSAEHPELTDRELYKKLVMARNECDPKTANEILKYAAESFASWPVSRELTLCDVVHYLTVTELIDSPDGDHRLHSNINHVVISRIPQELCVDRNRE